MVLKKILVTGASGMVGRHLVEVFLENGFTVVGSSRRLPDHVPESVEWVSHDLTDWKTTAEFDDLFGDVDYVVHAGAPVPDKPDALSDQELMEAGPRATLALASWSKQRRCGFQLISGALVYRDQDTTGLTEEAPTGLPEGPWRAYAASKLMSELAVQSVSSEEWSATILRATSVFGAGLPSVKLIPSWLNRLRDTGEIKLSPPVDDRINLLYALDLASASLAAMEAAKTGVFNVAGPEMVTMKRLAEACVEAIGSGKVSIGPEQAPRAASVRFDVSSAKAATVFGFTPEWGVDRALADIVARSQVAA